MLLEYASKYIKNRQHDYGVLAKMKRWPQRASARALAFGTRRRSVKVS